MKLLFPVVFALILSLLGSWARALEEIRVGSEAPSLELTSLAGEHFDLHKERRNSRLTVILFWATWSENSLKELARLEELFKKHSARGLKAAAVNVEGQEFSSKELQVIEKAKNQLELTMPILLDNGLGTFKRYGVVALPSTVVIGSDGSVLFRLAGYPLVGREELFDLLEASFEPGKKTSAIRTPGYRPSPAAARYYGLAMAMGRRGHLGEEERNLLKATELDPQFTLPLIRLGRIRLGKGDLAGAREFFSKALIIDPTDETARAEMGYVLLKQGELAQALAHFSQVLESQPGYAPAYYYLGLALSRQGKNNEALAQFAKAIELNPRDYRAYLFRGQLYRSTGMAKEAASDFRRAAELLGNFNAGPLPP